MGREIGFASVGAAATGEAAMAAQVLGEDRLARRAAKSVLVAADAAGGDSGYGGETASGAGMRFLLDRRHALARMQID